MVILSVHHKPRKAAYAFLPGEKSSRLMRSQVIMVESPLQSVNQPTDFHKRWHEGYNT